MFLFYDVIGEVKISMEFDFRPVAKILAARWQNLTTPFANMLDLLIATYQHETDRRDLNHDAMVDELELVQSHTPIISAFNILRDQAEGFVALAAGGFFDCLDLNRDGVLELADLEPYASSYS